MGVKRRGDQAQLEAATCRGASGRQVQGAKRRPRLYDMNTRTYSLLLNGLS